MLRSVLFTFAFATTLPAHAANEADLTMNYCDRAMAMFFDTDPELDHSREAVQLLVIERAMEMLGTPGKQVSEIKNTHELSSVLVMTQSLLMESYGLNDMFETFWQLVNESGLSVATDFLIDHCTPNS